MNALLKLLRIIATKKNSAGSVVIIALHKLGDAVFTIPAIKEIIEHYENKIVIVCYPETIPVYELVLTNVSYCAIEHSNFHFNDRYADRKARKLLTVYNPEIVFDITGVMTSVTLIFNCRAKLIIGMNRNHFKGLFDKYCEIRVTPNLIDKYLDVVSLAFTVKKNSRNSILTTDKEMRGPILIHAFAGWKAKEWNLEKYIHLARRLSDKYEVCFISRKHDISNDIVNEIKNHGTQLIQTESINELVLEIKKCSAFIGNDSGPLYIASTLGKPTFTIYGPTNPEFSLPLGDEHKFISLHLNCSPPSNIQYCFTAAGQRGCPAFNCMDQLDLEKVYSGVRQFLESNVK